MPRILIVTVSRDVKCDVRTSTYLKSAYRPSVTEIAAIDFGAIGDPRTLQKSESSNHRRGAAYFLTIFGPDSAEAAALYEASGFARITGIPKCTHSRTLAV